jgi:alpha-beta hydrolase superfamily lysophospholipase
MALGLCVLLLSAGCGSDELKHWHSKYLNREFSAGKAKDVHSFTDYLQLEAALFTQLDEKVYSSTPTGPEYVLLRYSNGSISDPRQRKPNWNRSFELNNHEPLGGVLLLHGMSDSPYSLRALGETFHKRGYQVVGPRLPGHGTAPSGLTRVHWQDMSAVVRLAMQHLADRVGERPLHIIGYSTGAALALDYALEAPAGDAPASLVLISPAIGVSRAAALANWKRYLSYIPGLKTLAYTDIEPEFDPYKYNSFATNAAEQVHLLTRSVGARIQQRHDAGTRQILPPTLVLKSTVDATVSNDAVVDRLLLRLAPDRHELVLFDINRFAPTSALMVADPGPFTQRLLQDPSLPFSLTLVGNTDKVSRSVSVSHKPPFAAQISHTEALGLEWPPGVLSLSHVALPFPPDDPLYGRYPPEDRNELFLGQQAMQGERGLLKISANYLLRLRHNPFYDYLEQRVLGWVETPR